MTPQATLRFRRVTAALAVAWALLALVAGVEGQLEAAARPSMPFVGSAAAGRFVLHEVAPSAREAGVEEGDRLLAVDGEPLAWWSGHQGFGGLELGEANRYRLRKPDAGVFEVALEPLPPGAPLYRLERVLDGALLLAGLVLLAIGMAVWRLKSERGESWALLVFCAVMGAQLFLAGPVPGFGAKLAAVNVPLIGATALHLFTSYPSEPAWVVRRPELRVVPYAFGFGLGALAVLEPWIGLAPGSVAPASTLYTVLAALGCGVILALERRQHRGDPIGDRAGVMLGGAALSFLPAIVAVAVHYATAVGFPWHASFLCFLVFPAAVAYGIVRRELFDVRMVAKSSAAYGAVTLAITGVFAFLVTFADAVVGRFNVDARSPAFSVVFLFFAILLFNPLRNRAQRLVDRYFDRDRLAYREAVREISEAMVSMLSVKEIVDRILVAVTDTMGVEGGMVLLLDDDERLRVQATRGDWDEEAASAELRLDHPLCRQLWMRRTELARSDFDEERDPEVREACRDVFDGLGAELLVPILFGVDLLGGIAVGRKLTGDRLGPDERQLLRTLANQSAIAIENAKAFDEIAKLNETLEARVEGRTRELRETQAQLMQSEKMRSLGQLVAGVAHELNNPIGFVHANLQLLDEHVSKLLQPEASAEARERSREAIRKLLTRSREGTDRVKRIVQDLRTFSRMDQAELQDVDVNEELDRNLALMEARLKKGVEVERDYGDIPRVRCFAGQLNQVFMNLLMNACDAMEGRGRITLRTRPVPSGVRIELADDGPGMPEEVRERIFEPFFTTKPVGQGTGLGLSLSHGIVERHGGRMDVESAPGEGTTFAIELPLVAKPPEGEAEDAEAVAAR